MQEESFSEMSLSRLLELQRTWRTQVQSNNGSKNSAKSLLLKLERLERYLRSREKENLNDLFA